MYKLKEKVAFPKKNYFFLEKLLLYNMNKKKNDKLEKVRKIKKVFMQYVYC